MSKPEAYVKGSVEFYHLHLEVNSSVLIPRQETEILADKVVSQIRKKGWDHFTVVDLCTGSGCLGLAIKSVFPKAHVILIDISEKALEVARRNALKNGLEVECRLGDALEDYQGPKIDLFLANPPYVTREEYEILDPCVKDFEPKIALYGGEEGLDVYQKISTKLFTWMREGGLAAFEIGWKQKEGFFRVFNSSPWRSIVCDKDWSGHDRFFFLER